MRLWAGALAVLAVGLSAATAPPEPDLSRRLSERGTEVLEALLGPGRGRAIVDARVETVETRAEYEGEPGRVPVEPPLGVQAPVLPGYARAASAARAGTGPAPRGASRTVFSDRGELVRSLRVSVFVCEDVPEESARSAQSAVAEAVGLDAARGDSIALVRTPARGAWARAFETPDARREGALALGAAGLAALGLLAVGWGAARAGRSLAEAVRSRPPAAAPEPAGPSRTISVLPRLGRGEDARLALDDEREDSGGAA